MTFEMSARERRELLCEIRADVVRALLDDKGEDLQLVSRSQAAGILDVTPTTLDNLIVLPRVMIGKSVRYRLSDLRAFIASNTER